MITQRIHQLKVWPKYIDALQTLDKPFEVRKHDRDFQRGDILNLVEFDPATGQYGDRHVDRRITYVMPGGQFGIEAGYCVLGLDDFREIPDCGA